MGRSVLPQGYRFRYVWTELEGDVSRERALTRFRPQGYATRTRVYLEDEEGEERTLVVEPLGRAEILEGHVEPE